MHSMVILGAGMVGAVMAEDLIEDDGRSVAIVDVSRDRLQRVHDRTGGRVRTIEADCSDPATVASVVEDFDQVLGALPSR